MRVAALSQRFMHMIITQKYLLKQLEKLTFDSIKHILGRLRLRFTRAELAFYLFQTCRATDESKHYSILYNQAIQNGELSISYQSYMANVELAAKLAPVVHLNTIRDFHVVKDGMLLIDSTNIPSKEVASIKQKDYDQKKVATRKIKAKNGKEYLKSKCCGYKVLLLLNGLCEVLFAKFLPINYSDQNILKDSAYYERFLIDTTVLADRGFNNKLVQARLGAIQGCEFVSPKLGKNPGMTKEKWAKYDKRWDIEVVFKVLKDPKGYFKLDFKGVRTLTKLKAKMYLTLAEYNLSMRQFEIG